MECIRCGTAVGAFTAKKFVDGCLCADCYGKIPKVYRAEMGHMIDFTVNALIDYAEKNLYRQFNATASYGTLHIDERHGLFAISKKLDEDGKPVDRYDVFSMYDLTELSFRCSSPAVSRNHVYCDVVFSAELEDLGLSFKTVVKKNTACASKVSDSIHIDWSVPYDMDMFRTVINEMLKGVGNYYQHTIAVRSIKKQELENARYLFMLPKGYTEQDVKQSRRKLLKVYHPDEGGDGSTEETQIINDAYSLLMAYAHKEEK